MNLGRPATVLCRTTLAATLEVLAGATRPLAGREVARLAPYGSVQGVLDALRHLVVHGLVSQEEMGNAHLYELNREHVAAQAVIELARLRDTFLRRVRDAISDWPKRPVHASLFGSAARGDGTLESDVDVLVVRSGQVTQDDTAWRDQLDDLAVRVLRWTGNQVRWLELSEKELTRMVHNREAIVDDWREDAIDLAGKPLRTLLRATP